MYDAAPLVDAESDTLIYPGENGVVYFIKLGTNYDPDAGTIASAPPSAPSGAIPPAATGWASRPRPWPMRATSSSPTTAGG